MGTTEDEMVGWHHWHNGHNEQALGVSDWQESLACSSPWGGKESDTTEWLNWNELSGRSDGKESACNAGDLGPIPGSGRPSGEGNGNPLSILAWRIPWTDHGVIKSQTQLSDWHFHVTLVWLKGLNQESPLIWSVWSLLLLLFSCSVMANFVTPWTVARQAFLSFTISQSLPKLISIELVMPSNHQILCPPLLLPLIFSSIRVFSKELALCIRWPIYWSFGFSISPSNEYSGLISFRIDWFDLLAVQGTLKSLHQHQSLKHQFFGAQGFPDSSVGKESTCHAGDPGLIPGLGRSAGEGISYLLLFSWASLVDQLVKSPPAMRETWVRFLGWEDPLKKGKATHSSTLAWRIPWIV